MKKIFLLTLALASLASYAFGQAGADGTSTSTFSFNPSSQTASSNSTFQVTLSITGGVQSITGGGTGGAVDAFDLWLATDAANSGLFTIDSVTYTRFTSFGNLGPGFGDTLSDSSDISSGYVRNTADLGNIDSSPAGANAIGSGQTFQVATFTISTGVLSPGTTYNFFTTLGANLPLAGVATSNSHYSDVIDSSNRVFTVAQSTFSITAAAVPEPSTWSLVALGGLGFVGVTMLRRRRLS